jgi:hypothetical protein
MYTMKLNNKQKGDYKMGIDFRLEVEVETEYCDEDGKVIDNSKFPIATFELGNLRLFRSILTQKEIDDYHGKKILSGEAVERWLDSIKDNCGAVVDLVYDFISNLNLMNRLDEDSDQMKSKVLVTIIWC